MFSVLGKLFFSTMEPTEEPAPVDDPAPTPVVVEVESKKKRKRDEKPAVVEETAAKPKKKRRESDWFLYDKIKSLEEQLDKAQGMIRSRQEALDKALTVRDECSVEIKKLKKKLADKQDNNTFVDNPHTQQELECVKKALAMLVDEHRVLQNDYEKVVVERSRFESKVEECCYLMKIEEEYHADAMAEMLGDKRQIMNDLNEVTQERDALLQKLATNTEATFEISEQDFETFDRGLQEEMLLDPGLFEFEPEGEPEPVHMLCFSMSEDEEHFERAWKNRPELLTEKQIKALKSKQTTKSKSKKKKEEEDIDEKKDTEREIPYYQFQEGRKIKIDDKTIRVEPCTRYEIDYILNCILQDQEVPEHIKKYIDYYPNIERYMRANTWTISMRREMENHIKKNLSDSEMSIELSLYRSTNDYDRFFGQAKIPQEFFDAANPIQKKAVTMVVCCGYGLRDLTFNQRVEWGKLEEEFKVFCLDEQKRMHRKKSPPGSPRDQQASPIVFEYPKEHDPLELSGMESLCWLEQCIC